MIRICRVETLLLEHHPLQFRFLSVEVAALIAAKIPVTKSGSSLLNAFIYSLCPGYTGSLPFLGFTVHSYLLLHGPDAKLWPIHLSL